MAYGGQELAPLADKLEVVMPLAMVLEIDGLLEVIKFPQIFWNAVMKSTLKVCPG